MKLEDPETGISKTVVVNDDGTQRVFGEMTVTSMADTNEDDIKAWLGAMTDLQLRGLVHEVTDRVFQGSEAYHTRKKDLGRRSETRHYKFFGLSPESACEKDLDASYRRLAREMHPDKNGGTEAAKKRFQGMKRRYEDLKLRIPKAQAPKDPSTQQPQQPSPEHTDSAAPELPQQPPPDSEASELPADEPEAPQKRPPRRREAYDDDEEECGGGDQDAPKEVINCYTDDRVELDALAWKMLRQLKNIRHQMSALDGEYPDAESDEPEDIEPDAALADLA